jgi:ribonuclease P protein subunit RPR2
MRSRRKPEYQIKIAKERIEILFKEAEKMVKEDPKLANRYVKLARKIGMRYNVRLGKDLKRKVCKYCKGFLYPGVTCQTRVSDGYVKIKCLHCNRVLRYPLNNG